MAQLIKTRGTKVDRTCKCCKKVFSARKADVDRGWAQFCSKSCKAVKQEARTGQYRDYLRSGGGAYDGMSANERMYEEAMFDSTTSHGQTARVAFDVQGTLHIAQDQGWTADDDAFRGYGATLT